MLKGLLTFKNKVDRKRSGKSGPSGAASMRLLRKEQDSHPQPKRTSSRPDRVLRLAIENGILTEEQLSVAVRAMISAGLEPTWRNLVARYPSKRERFQELASKVYGFRRLLICEVGTLVYNDRLTALLSESDWEELLTENVLPVIEYDVESNHSHRHLLGSPDPGSPGVRKLIKHLPLHSYELVYVPELQMKELQGVLISQIPQIGAAALMSTRKNIRVLTINEMTGHTEKSVRRAA